jgi:hypothetical protein
MTVNTVAYFYSPGGHVGGTGFSFKARGLGPETPPDIIWGTGTPDGDRAPFNVINKGSIYMQVDGADDGAVLWQKVDEGGDNNDWKPIGSPNYAVSKDFNIDNGSGTTEDDIILVPNRTIVILSARVVYVEATDTAGAAGATVQLGTAVGGEQIAAAAALEVSKAVGDYTDLTLVSGIVVANGMIAVRHTGIAATEAGQYFVQIEYV